MSNLTITYTKKKRKRSLSHNTEELPPDTCVFCRSAKDSEEEYGKIIKKCGFTVHYFCMLFASGLSQSGKTESQGIYGFMPADIRRELNRGCRLRCTYCKDKGATIGCVVTSCRRAFHLTCGREKGSLHQFFDSFRSYCSEHRPRQTVQISDRLAFVGTANTVCSICMYAVVARSSNETLRAPCCKNSWFHRSCIQRYALSAGLYFFKCPLCNSKDHFQTEMLQYGIYIPDQDAAWEREPNAFQDLYERYAHCDADKCKCPEGRDYDEDNTKWEILVCEFCGSKGSHSACGGLKRLRKDLACAECDEIDKKTRGNKGKKKSPKVRNRTQAELQQLLEQRVSELVAMKAKAQQNTPTLKEATPKSKSTIPVRTPLSKYGTPRSLRSTPTSSLGDPDVHIMQRTDTDTEIDIEASDTDENSSRSATRKRRRLSVSVTRSNSKKKTRQSGTVSSNVEVEASGDSCLASIQTKTTQGKYSNYVTLSTVTDNDVRKWGTSDRHTHEASSELRQTSLLTCSSDEDYSSTIGSSDSGSDSDSEICAVDEVHEDSSKKTVTIKWKGKKIRIYKEVEKDDREDISKWSLHLEVGDSDDHKPSSSRAPFQQKKPFTKAEESPPQLVPIDDEITFKCTPPTRPYMLNMHSSSEYGGESGVPTESASKSGPPVLCPVWEEDDDVDEQTHSRVTRSMSSEGKCDFRQESVQLSSSQEPFMHKGLTGRGARHSRRSLERAFTYQDYCQSIISNICKWDDTDSISSTANSVITLSSNASENGDDESDCVIVEPVYVTENQKCVQDGRVVYSAQIAVGSPFKDQDYPEAVPYRQITTGTGSLGMVIDLTGSPTETWDGLADTDISPCV